MYTTKFLMFAKKSSDELGINCLLNFLIHTCMPACPFCYTPKQSDIYVFKESMFSYMSWTQKGQDIYLGGIF